MDDSETTRRILEEMGRAADEILKEDNAGVASEGQLMENQAELPASLRMIEEQRRQAKKAAKAKNQKTHQAEEPVLPPKMQALVTQGGEFRGDPEQDAPKMVRARFHRGEELTDLSLLTSPEAMRGVHVQGYRSDTRKVETADILGWRQFPNLGRVYVFTGMSQWVQVKCAPNYLEQFKHLEAFFQEPKPEAAKPKPAQAPGGGGGATAMEWILGRPGPKETNHTSHAPLDTASKSLPSSRIPVRHKRRWVADLMSNSRPLKIPRKRVPAPAVSPPAVKKKEPSVRLPDSSDSSDEEENLQDRMKRKRTAETDAAAPALSQRKRLRKATEEPIGSTTRQRIPTAPTEACVDIQDSEKEEEDEEDEEELPVCTLFRAWEGSPVSDDVSEDEEGGAGAGANDDEDVEQEEKSNEIICFACDDGGNLLKCDGVCMRSFHRQCVGIHNSEFKTIMGEYKSQIWMCPNCTMHVHQCYICKETGKTPGAYLDELDGKKLELVRPCLVDECGKFYHDECLKALKSPPGAWDKFESIRKCPLHTCNTCGGDEDCRAAHMEQRELIKCRRCVTSYHKDCVPDELRDYERVEGMLCLRLWTPINKPMNSKGELDVERQKEEAYMQKCMFREVYQGKARKEVLINGDMDMVDQPLIFCKAHELDVECNGTRSPSHIKPVFSKALIHAWRSIRLPLSASAASGDVGCVTPVASVEQTAAGKEAMLAVATLAALEATQAVEAIEASDAASQSDESVNDPEDFDDGVPPVQAPDVLLRTHHEMESRLSAIRRWSIPMVSPAAVKAALIVPAPYDKGEITRNAMGNTASEERLAQMVQQIEMAQTMNASDIIHPGFIKQTNMMSSALRVRVGPYLYRVKYSSFGRHFTTTVKLETVTSHLMYFLRKGDCCVDFSCGSNEFLSMLEKKSAMAGLGNSMSYVGFDILPASIQRNFVMKSWFDVRQHDLLSETNLDPKVPTHIVVGLNPPFGVKSAMAIKFIQHSLQFMPRVIVLIVPQDTSLPLFGQTYSPYSLWKGPEHISQRGAHNYALEKCLYKVVHWNTDLLSGEAFYFPGSLDVISNTAAPDHNQHPPAFIILQHINADSNSGWQKIATM